jgi:hypothetical protein
VLFEVRDYECCALWLVDLTQSLLGGGRRCMDPDPLSQGGRKCQSTMPAVAEAAAEAHICSGYTSCTLRNHGASALEHEET